jgi:hypothetical protein
MDDNQPQNGWLSSTYTIDSVVMVKLVPKTLCSQTQSDFVTNDGGRKQLHVLASGQADNFIIVYLANAKKNDLENNSLAIECRRFFFSRLASAT